MSVYYKYEVIKMGKVIFTLDEYRISKGISKYKIIDEDLYSKVDTKLEQEEIKKQKKKRNKEVR